MEETQTPTAEPRTKRARVPRTPQRRGRVLALQVLFEVDLTGHDWQASLRVHAKAVGSSDAVAALAEAWVAGVMTFLEQLDAVLARNAPMWPVDQLSAVDRNILRLALYEIQPGSATPPKVAINEAIELAKQFGGEASSRFVNGVLGSALEEFSSAEVSTT
jgi:N utilization substance protein B